MRLFWLGAYFICLTENLWSAETFDFNDVQENTYRLCSMTASQALDPLSELEKECCSFMEDELNNEAIQEKTRLQSLTSKEVKTPYFKKFLEKASQQKNHRLLILFKRIDLIFSPIGMGKVDILEDLNAHIPEETSCWLMKNLGSLDHGYCIGGSISPLNQNKGIATSIFEQCLEIVLGKIYREPHCERTPPYLFISTKIDNGPMNHICKKKGYQRITSDLGKNYGTLENPIPIHEYIVLPVINFPHK